jgi:hypothetical protein
MALPPKAVAALPRGIRQVISHPWSRARRLKLSKRRRRELRQFLDKHGHITPSFTWDEARSNANPEEPDGKPVPDRLRPGCIHHGWALERLRHRCDDKPLGFLSWYRTPIHNRIVGGASQSRHMQADATDLTPATIANIGRDKLMAEANRVFAKGGVGDYPSGAVHVDSRGTRARWSSF